MRPASWRWLSPRTRRMSRTARATLISSSLAAALAVATTNWGSVGSGSSISSGLWQRLQSEFDVRNCTRLQCSQRSTSRASTVARIVAISSNGVPERALPLSKAADYIRSPSPTLNQLASEVSFLSSENCESAEENGRKPEETQNGILQGEKQMIADKTYGHQRAWELLKEW